MPTAGPGLSATLVVLLLGGAAAGTASMDVAEDLEGDLKLLMKNTMRDLDVGWLDAVSAYGNHTGEAYDGIQVLVRADGTSQTIAVDELLILDASGNELATTIEPVRDDDGSLADGELGPDDMARLTIELAEPVTDDRLELTVHHPSKPPLQLHLGLPNPPDSDSTRLDIHRDW